MGFDNRHVMQLLGTIYKVLILVTLGSLFAFAPLRGTRQLAQQNGVGQQHAAIEEIPEIGGPNKILWLDPTRVVRGQGESFRLAFEE